jgi:hypothetical protein
MNEDTPRTNSVRALRFGNVRAMDALAEALETELLAAQERIRELEAEIGILKMGFVPQKD